MEFITHSKPSIDKDDIKIALECMVSDYIGPGKLVSDFEDLVAKIFNRPFAVATYSGSIALFIILRVLGLRKGDSVIISAYSPHQIINALYYLGVKPVLVDINPDYSLSIEDIDKKINNKVKAIVITPLFSAPVGIEEYKKYNLPLIYNATQVLGSSYQNEPPGKGSDFIFLSFYATKVITTGGMGGIILTSSKEYYESMRKIISREPDGITYPLLITDLQASIGISQIKRLSEFIAIRSNIAKFYTENFKSIKTISLPPFYTDRTQSFFRYVIKVKDVNRVVKLSNENKVEVKRPIEKPLYFFLNKDFKEYPNSHLSYVENLSIPIYPTLTNTQAKKIIKVVSNIVSPLKIKNFSL